MFTITDNCFDHNLYISTPIDESQISGFSIKYFDNDGFELTTLEKAYYEAAGVDVGNEILNHSSNQKVWIQGGNNQFIIDHGILLQRWGFEGEALEQIREYSVNFPQLKKFIKIVPKWGVDFLLEYYYEDSVVEVIHFENDYRYYQQAELSKQLFEIKIQDTDWDDFVKQVNKRKDEWIHLKGFDQNNWKASYWGLPKAELTEKTF